ncbi:MAG TPA: glycosyltransferase family 2 protein [Candidatus Dormibacteraeota bacterium]|nr:glycosyltransferase family 2 protein [Candidatus Dormibacteraeota bacterium]
MKFTVCLPASRPSSVGATIWSIAAQTVTDWELLVVGQGDDRAVRAAVAAAGAGDPRIRYLHLTTPGSSRARTAAIHAAQGEILAMTDDDCEARPDWLAVIETILTDDPDVALVGGSMLAPLSSPVWPASCPSFVATDALYDPARNGRTAPAGWDWVGGNFALRRHVAEMVGDFDACLGIGGDFEAAGDTDYKLRMEAMGLKMRTTPRSIVDHTYGWRYGVHAVLRHQRTHARGNGALAAKLTLMGDPRGQAWLSKTRHDVWSGWLPLRRTLRRVADLRVLFHFSRAYAQCRRRYRVNARGLLELKPATVDRAELERLRA